MRKLTEQQRDILACINTTEQIEERKKRADTRWAEARAQHEKERREREENIRPLKEALRAAGIKLEVTRYEGLWGSFQIGSGPVTPFDDDFFSTFAED